MVFATTSSDSVLPQIMSKLKRMGIRSVLVSGDNAGAARHLGGQLGLVLTLDGVRFIGCTLWTDFEALAAAETTAPPRKGAHLRGSPDNSAASMPASLTVRDSTPMVSSAVANSAVSSLIRPNTCRTPRRWMSDASTS